MSENGALSGRGGSLLSEAWLQRIWGTLSFDLRHLCLEDGRSLEILFPGTFNGGVGPDFRSAWVRLGGEIRVGDVELHLVPGGWHAHGHGRDGGYEGVVLHVVLDRDGRDLPGPVLVLRPLLRRSAWEWRREGAPPWRTVLKWPSRPADLERLLVESGRRRWERRRAVHEAEVRRIGLEEASHRAFFTALGYRNNRGPFRELARLVPSREVAGLPGERVVERLHEGAERVGIWRRRGNRPVNGVGGRIESAGGVLSRGAVGPRMRAILHSRKGLSGVESALRVWGGLGRDRSGRILLDALLPCIAPETGLKVLSGHPPLARTGREREMIRTGPPELAGCVKSFLAQLGLFELHDGLAGREGGAGLAPLGLGMVDF